MNKTIHIGRLTKDPEITVTNTGYTIATVTIAVDRNYGKETDFFTYKRISKTDPLNNTIKFIGEYCKKGDLVLIEGNVKNSSYEKDGEKRYRDEYFIDQFRKISSPKKFEESHSDPVRDINEDVLF